LVIKIHSIPNAKPVVTVEPIMAHCREIMQLYEQLNSMMLTQEKLRLEIEERVEKLGEAQDESLMVINNIKQSAWKLQKYMTPTKSRITGSPVVHGLGRDIRTFRTGSGR